MGFLAPGAFLAGAALLLAILATYLLRPRRPTRRVSSTFLWLAALNDVQAQQPWRRVPPSLLLLLQIAALVAMVAALARPYLLSADSAGPFSVVLIDASASMQATDTPPSRFEVARARVSQMIDALEPGKTLALVSLDAQPRVVAPPSGDRGQLHRALASACLSWYLCVMHRSPSLPMAAWIVRRRPPRSHCRCATSRSAPRGPRTSL